MTNIKFTLKNRVAWIIFDTPQKHNALTLQDIKKLNGLIKDCEKIDLVAVVFTGIGKSFCSGVSLSNFVASDWMPNPLSSLCEAIQSCRVITICALNGGVYGGAVDLALSCDFRIGHREASMMFPPSKLGIHYEPSGIKRAINIMGLQNTRKLLLLAQKFKGIELLEIGFLDYLVNDSSAVNNKATEIIAMLSKNAPMAVNGMKKTIVEIGNENLNIESARLRIRECFLSNDHIEGINAFKEKRSPNFKGR